MWDEEKLFSSLTPSQAGHSSQQTSCIFPRASWRDNKQAGTTFPEHSWEMSVHTERKGLLLPSTQGNVSP